MTPFEKAVVSARELDKLYPQFSHMVGFRLNIIRVKRVKKVVGWPTNTDWIGGKPFTGDKQGECDYMYSALRRMVIRGHFKEVYDGMPVKELK